MADALPALPLEGMMNDSSATAVKTMAALQQRYAAERDKRVKPEGIAQYIDLQSSDRFRHLQDDPWVDHTALNQREPAIKDGDHVNVLILGTGYTGLLFAVRMMEAGIAAEDIRLVDSAGRFGGTWYCYIYMPLVEELGYIPKHKYAYGPELRAYAETIADKYDLRDKTSFRTEVKGMHWFDDEKAWQVSMNLIRGPSEGTSPATVKADFVIMASGLLNYPQIPRLVGHENFEGHIFHTSRFEYAYTGGSPTDPALVNLKDKSVGIIGTGASGVQAIPAVAKWAKQLYVFQRTPADVDQRDNRPTDVENWQRDVATNPGWQAERRWNFLDNLSSYSSPKPAVDIVFDGRTRSPSIGAILGAPGKGTLKMEDVPAHVAGLHAIDLVRQQRIRQRVVEIVQDEDTAEKLTPWYPSWCKRPCFHDEYLPTFNRKNVTLISNPRGVDALTENGAMVGGKEYNVDCLILSTGFRNPFVGSPATKGSLTVTGRNGRTLDSKWADKIATLHGVCSNGFPNLFWPGVWQAALDATWTHTADRLARHIGHIVVESMKRSPSGSVSIEPSVAAEEAWSMRILEKSAGFAAMAGCTPGYFNSEGAMDRASDEDKMKMARGAGWANGFRDYIDILEKWKVDGKMEGLEIVAGGGGQKDVTT